ncbi:MAG: hypothetical protein IT559_06235 [Alphaproteobacteria bacterium]|nr:hypothetical protein [Alphaproteobacteria bacterium]
MQQTAAHTLKAPSPLPIEKSQALNMMIRITQSLLTLAERESQALAMNDMLSFAILQDEKNLVKDQYIQLSEAFRTNIEAYRGVDKALLDRLESLQNALAEKTRSNNLCVNTIYERARGKTQSALITAQELGQQRPVSFAHAPQETPAGMQTETQGAL